MKNVRRAVLPALYIGVIGVMILSVILVISGIKSYLAEKPTYNYTLDGAFQSDILPVIKTESDKIIKPYLNEEVKISKHYYDYKSDNKKEQEESLIEYKNTYFQNKGIDYVSNDMFDVVASLDGEVTSIEDNEIYGKVLTITHNENFKTVYSNIEDILVNVGYKVSTGEIIARSNISNFNNKEQLLHFEVYYKDKTINPENIYSLTIEELNKME